MKRASAAMAADEFASSELLSSETGTAKLL